MKEILKFTAFILYIGIVIFVSCKKENSCEGCVDKNKPPFAVAGPDQVITLPKDSIALDGSVSKDPDGTISIFFWTKISGPASFNIIRSSDSITAVKSLVTGTYQFELKVTDNGGLSAKDTMQVIVDALAITNHPPIANAGADQTIILPTSTISLDGSASSDPDNNITTYAWTKISGPSSFSIVNPRAAQTQATNLGQGVYQFELRVTDAGGLFSKDTMQVTVNAQQPPQPTTCEPLNRPIINAQLIPFGNLSLARSEMAVASAGNKILFAGGVTQSGPSTRVDIYDISTNTWSISELSMPRRFMTSASAGTKIFFAGGYVDPFGQSSRIDIYDAASNSWSTAELSAPRFDLAATAIGNKVFFAGGQNYSSGTNTPISRIDIYNISSNSWSTAELSQPRFGLSATTSDNKIYIAGGWNFIDGPSSGVIDIYNGQTDAWSTSSLVSPKAYHAAIAIQDKIFWAGGDTLIDLANEIDLTCQVEIRNTNTQTSTFTNLSHPSQGFAAFAKNDKIVYLPGFDIYDLTSNTWFIGQLNQSLPDAIIFVNNTIYVAGGSNQVWKLEF